MRTIGLWELKQLEQRAGFKQRGLSLEADEEVLDWLAAHGYHPLYGARFLRRIIERKITTAVAERIVRINPVAGTKIALKVLHNNVIARLVDSAPSERSAREVVRMPVGTAEKVTSLDPEALRREADRVLEHAEERLSALRDKKERYSEILVLMNRA
jgi:regulator of sirC expression with transglutaminase-like and TPR domain